MKDNLTFQSKKYFCNSKISLLNIFFIEVSLDQSKVQNLRHSSQQEAMRLELPFTPKFYIWMKQQSCNTKSVKCLVQSAVQWLVSRTKEMYWGDLELGDIECNNLMLNLNTRVQSIGNPAGSEQVNIRVCSEKKCGSVRKRKYRSDQCGCEGHSHAYIIHLTSDLIIHLHTFTTINMHIAVFYVNHLFLSVIIMAME